MSPALYCKFCGCDMLLCLVWILWLGIQFCCSFFTKQMLSDGVFIPLDSLAVGFVWGLGVGPVLVSALVLLVWLLRPQLYFLGGGGVGLLGLG